MRKKGLFTIAAAAAVTLTAATAPAFTADNAGLSVTVRAQPPATPCVMFASSPGTQVTFGSLPFSNQRDPSAGNAVGSIAPRYSNCGTAQENLFITSTDAQNVCTGPCIVHTWTNNGARGECPALNGYQLWYGVDGVGSNPLMTTTVPLQKLGVPNHPSDYAPGEAHDLNLQFRMPCEGSDGAAEDFRFAVTVTAAVA